MIFLVLYNKIIFFYFYLSFNPFFSSGRVQSPTPRRKDSSRQVFRLRGRGIQCRSHLRRNSHGSPGGRWWGIPSTRTQQARPRGWWGIWGRRWGTQLWVPSTNPLAAYPFCSNGQGSWFSKSSSWKTNFEMTKNANSLSIEHLSAFPVLFDNSFDLLRNVKMHQI